MISQLFMAKSAFFSFQRKMQVISNNIANAETIGYKKRRVEMESLFPLVLERAYSEFDETAGGPGAKRKKYMEYGQGVRMVDITKDFSSGTMEVTNQPFDFAIEGQGMFQFSMPDGSVAYSRAGNLHMDSQGRIMDPNGHLLIPNIQIPQNTTEVIVNEEGRVFVRSGNQDQSQEIGQILLARFQNPVGLKDAGQNLYRQTDASGPPQILAPGSVGAGFVKQRALEFSNVNVVDELMHMLLTQRAFEIIVKTINGADAMLKTASDITK